jgi:hypothetical protein
MGLFKRMKDPVRGEAKVAFASTFIGGDDSDSHLRLVVTAEGVPPTPVEVKTRPHRDRWPHEGDTIPVTVDRANPQDVKIEWSGVQSPSDGLGQREERATQDALREARGEPHPLTQQERATLQTIEETRRTWRDNLKHGYCSHSEFDRQMEELDQVEQDLRS